MLLYFQGVVLIWIAPLFESQTPQKRKILSPSISTARIVTAMKVAYQPLGTVNALFFRNRFRISFCEVAPITFWRISSQIWVGKNIYRGYAHIRTNHQIPLLLRLYLASCSPTPSAKAAKPCTNTGTSAPSFRPISASSSSERFNSHR